MATHQPLTPAIARTSVRGGWTDAGILTGVTDQKAQQLGWGPCRVVTVQNPFWLIEGVTGNPWDIIVGGPQIQTIELTPGSMKDFACDNLEQIWVRRVIGFTADEPNHDPVDVHWFLNYDPQINLNPYIQNIAQGGLRLNYNVEREKFLDDLFQSYQRMYTDRATK